MSYYRYLTDPDNFDAFGVPISDHERVVDIHFDDVPRLPSWRAVAISGFKDNPGREADFPSLNDYNKIPLMSERAWNALRPLVVYCCESLAIIHPTGLPYSLIHVMDTIDVLDEERSELTRNEVTNRVSRVYRFAFKPGMLNGKHIFKLPLKSGSDLIVDDEFRRIVEANGLKGLIFKEIPLV